MFDDSNIIVGLEIGTSKVCAVVGEQAADGALNIIGLGQARSRGVRKGEIVDPKQAEEDVRNAIVEAERWPARKSAMFISASPAATFAASTTAASIPWFPPTAKFPTTTFRMSSKTPRPSIFPADNDIVHAIRQHFFVDGQDGITNPVGMLGSRLEVDVHVVHGNTNRLQNAIRVVKGLQIQVNEIVFNGLAASLALLSNEQKELGALVIDIGGGTTDYVVYVGGVIKHTGVLAIGGDHVSNDLAYGLKVPLSRAEKLKLEHGSAIVDEASKGRDRHLHERTRPALKTVNVGHLQRIMSLRLEEIFQLIAQDLEQAGLCDYLRAGVFLTGGGARIPHIAKLAEPVLQMPVSIGQTNSISGLKSALDQPEFAAAIGLVRFGSFKNRKRDGKSSFAQGIKGMFGKLLSRS